MVRSGRPFRASYVLSDVSKERVFEALLAVRDFPRWAVGLRTARVLDADGLQTHDLRPGSTLEFSLSAAGLTHEVASEVSVVEPPRRLEWRYTRGASGNGGWLVEREGARNVRMTLSTDYRVRPLWLDKIAHRPFFRDLTEDLLRRSIRRFEHHLR